MEREPVWLTDMQVPRVDLVKLPANNAPAGDEGKVTGGLVDNGTTGATPPHAPGQAAPATRPPQHVPHAPNQDATQAVVQGLQHLVQLLQAAGDPQSQQLAQQLCAVLEHLTQPNEGNPANGDQTQAVAGAYGSGDGNFGAQPKPVANPDTRPNAGGRSRQGPLFFPVSNSAIPSNIRRSMASLIRYAVRNGLEDIFTSETIGAAELLGDHFREGHDHLLCQHSICEAVLTSKERNDIPKTEFAYEDKLPLNDAAHVRNALSRFDETDIPDSARPAAMAKIRSAAKRFGIKVSDEKRSSDSDQDDDDGSTTVKNNAPAAGGKTPTGKMSDDDKNMAKCDYSESSFGAISLVESEGKPRGSIWDVALIKAGMSLNRNNYPVDVLRSAVGAGLFEGVRAYADHPSKAEELSRPERSVRDIVGFYRNATWSESTQEVRSHLHITSPWLREAMLEAFDAGNPNLYGFSIRADGQADVARSNDGRTYQDVKRLTRVASVDVVTDPAAGGRTVELLASNRQETTSKQEGSVKEDGTTSVAEVTALKESADAALKEVQAILAETKRVQFQAGVERSLAESKLPEQGQNRVRALFEGKSEGDVAAAIVAERDYIAAVSGFGVKDHGGSRVQVTEADVDKLGHAMFGMLDGKSEVEGVPAFRSLREAYSKITGIPDYDIDPYKWLFESYAGTASEAGTNTRLREAMTTGSWTRVFGDSITRKMLKEYQLPGYDAWRQLVSEIGNIKDFRTQRRLRMGGYGALPAVAQGGSYNPLTSPTDEEATFAITKRGGTEQLTMEMLVNDDLGAVRRIPTKLGRAAAMTLYRFVFDMVKDNATVLWDGLTLYDIALGHANYTVNPLTSDNLTTAKIQMRKQVGYNLPANDTLLTEPKFIVVAPDLEPAAKVLLQSDKLPGTLDNDVNIHKGTLTPIVVNYWTAPRQWFLVGDPNLINTLEIGFLNGKQEPELFVQDMQNVGVMFDSDQIKYKIRHIYGGAPVEYRGFQGNFAP